MEELHLSTGKTRKVTYLFGKSLDLPEWVCTKRGKDLVKIVRKAFQRIDKNYTITRKDKDEYDLELGYLLKLWSQHASLFPIELKETLMAIC